MATLIRSISANKGLKLKKENPVAEVRKKAAKGSDLAAEVLHEAGAPVGVMVRAMRKSLELDEMDEFVVLYADTCDEVTEFIMPVAMAAEVYLSQRSGAWSTLVCAVGAAQL